MQRKQNLPPTPTLLTGALKTKSTDSCLEI